MLADSLGQPVTLDHPESLGALNDFVEGFLRSQARVANVLQLAETDHSAMAQAACAALHMFAESPEGPVNARPFIQRALAASPRATRREQQWVAAVAAWVDGDLECAIALHEAQASEFPRDLISLKLGLYHLFNLGRSPDMVRMARQALPQAADVAELHGMLAFAWEQCHRLRDAEHCARHAISMRPSEPWAHHALAHVMLTEGRMREGHAFMTAMSPHWVGLNSFMETHNWWHQALFCLELGDPAQALQLYDQRVWGVVKGYSQDQINAVSLLARLELAGTDVGDRWHDVATHMAARVHDQVLPFLDLQYLYGLARAGRPEADALLDAIVAHAAQATEPQRAAWQQVAVPAAQALLAHARGAWPQAVAGLEAALPRLVAIGGSHAQRDLFAQIHIDALRRSGELRGAQHLLRQAANSQIESQRLARLARAVEGQLGLPGAGA
jgi:hypothetical protein